MRSRRGHEKAPATSPTPGTAAWPARVSAVLTVVVGVAFVALSVAALTAGHGRFSIGVAGMLAVYGLLVVAVGWRFWRLRPISRGPLITTALLNLLVASDAVRDPHLGWVAALVVVVMVITVVGALAPSTTRALATAAERSSRS